MKKKIIYSLILAVILAIYFFGWQKKETVITEPRKTDIVVKEEYIPDPNAPKFEDYPISERFNGTPVAPDFKTNPEAKRYYTRITEGSKGNPGFAGGYFVFIYGCGFGCQYNTIVSAKTGKIIAYNIESNRGSKYNSDSRLFIVNPPEELYDSYGNDIPSYVSTQYYYLSEDGSELIRL